MTATIQPGDIVLIDYGGTRQKTAVYLGHDGEKHIFRDDSPFPFAFSDAFIASRKIAITPLMTD